MMRLPETQPQAYVVMQADQREVDIIRGIAEQASELIEQGGDPSIEIEALARFLTQSQVDADLYSHKGVTLGINYLSNREKIWELIREKQSQLGIKQPNESVQRNNHHE